MRTLVVFGCLFLALNVRAQVPSLTDSLNLYLNSPGRWIGKVQTTHSFITGKPVRTFGIKVGRTHENRISYGLGVNWMDRGIQTEVLDSNVQRKDVRMLYASGFFEYSFWHQSKWRISLPIRLGMGTSWHKQRNIEGMEERTDQSMIILYEPSMVCEYQLIKYLAIGLEVGYRLMLLNNKNIPKQFTAPTWGIRIRINSGQLLEDVKR
ncbi:MAG: hypothetical protein HRT74_00450 [Flavobacteriales bacterium]|nr:hypothetical protein [Flavobacteriales bacterium]